jgi:hypothetical protein
MYIRGTWECESGFGLENELIGGSVTQKQPLLVHEMTCVYYNQM